MKIVLWELAELIRRIAIFQQPVMPESSEKILRQLGLNVPDGGIPFSALDEPMPGGQKIEKPTPIFPRYIDEDETQK